MLAALTVRDIVLIEQAALEFSTGLNVLTGETGAGKSILLDALGLAAGSRAGGRASIRPEASQGSATAVFEIEASQTAKTLLHEHGIAAGEEVVLRRTLAADGRTRAFINDEPVGVALLRDLGGVLLEIHGQADDRGLFDTATHRVLLDCFGNHDGLTREVAARFDAFEAAKEEAERVRRETAAAEADADFVKQVVDELSALDPREGEELALVGERALLVNATRIAGEVSAAGEALGGEKGAEALLALALKRLGRLSEDAHKAVASVEATLEQAFALTEDGRRELEAFLSRLDADPGALERKDDRLHALRAAARKFSVSPDQLPDLRKRFEAKRDALESGGGKLKEATEAETRARRGYLDKAEELSKARGRAARSLEAAVAAELVPLKLGHARFRVALAPLGENAGADGLERIAFEVATVEGAEFGALVRIASGGELARFSLALKVALADQGSAALVFDEVDRGVGGAVADAVGERLQRLAETTQVLLVTHSPQVAARAERHFRITRARDKTRVELLSDEARLEEIARMLSGAAVSEEARAAARKLIQEARGSARQKKRKRA